MNYEILLYEALTKADPNYLAEHIYREFKKAEREYYSSHEFFQCCISTLKHWMERIDQSFEILQSNLLIEENNIHLAQGTDEQKERALKQLEHEKKEITKETVGITIGGENYKQIKFSIASIFLADVNSLSKAVEQALQLVNGKKRTLEPQQNTKQKPELSDLITHQNGNKIAEGIKIQYKNIKGKQLKLLLLALQELELLPKDRIGKKFYDCCKNEFDWNIASYNAMIGYSFNDKTDIDELESKKQYIKTIIA